MSFGLIPIRNFGVINKDRQIYRSAQPIYSYEFLWLVKMLGIKYIVNLRKESRRSDYAKSLGVKVINLNIVDHKPPTLKQATDFIHLIRRIKSPILVHCEHGHGRTSTFSVLAKISLGMPLKKALEDERDRFHYMFKHPAQLQFLENNFS